MNTRRSLAGGAVLALLGTAAASAAPAAEQNPDAELIALCREFCASDTAFRALYDGVDAIEDEDAAALAAMPICAHQDALLDAMERVRATTAHGIQARAEALAQHNAEHAFSADDGAGVTGRLLRYLMRDAAALSTDQVDPAPAAVASPDASLLAVCARFGTFEREYQRIANSCKTIEAEHAADPVLDRIREQQEPLLDQICAMQPTTSEGMAALATALTLWDAELYFEEDDRNADTNERLLAALLRSVLAGRA